MYESNPLNTCFYYFHFDGDERLITGQQIYFTNDDIVERLNNVLVIDVYMNRM